MNCSIMQLSEHTTLVYDPVGKCVLKTVANGVVTSHTFDVAGWLRVVDNTDALGTAVSRYTYTYDPVGNRTSELAADGELVLWSYDRLYQLTGEQRLEDAGLSGDELYATTYTYDPAGNRVLRADDGEVTTYTYDPANQLTGEVGPAGVTTYQYDADGNQTRKDSPSELTEYVWDEENRLVEAAPVGGEVTLVYNGDGQRVAKQTPTDERRFVYDFKHLLLETDATGDVENEYTFTNGEWGDLVSEHGDGESSYHQYDAQWSTTALSDPDGLVSDRYQWRAFGLEQSHTGPSESRLLWVGKQGYYRDIELDLYLLGSSNNSGGGRYYDPETGRFLSEDPLGEGGGDTNLYRYVGNNPVNVIDPSGEVAEEQKKALRALIVKLCRPDGSKQENGIHRSSQTSGLFQNTTSYPVATASPPEFYASSSSHQNSDKSEECRRSACLSATPANQFQRHPRINCCL